MRSSAVFWSGLRCSFTHLAVVHQSLTITNQFQPRIVHHPPSSLFLCDNNDYPSLSTTINYHNTNLFQPLSIHKPSIQYSPTINLPFTNHQFTHRHSSFLAIASLSGQSCSRSFNEPTWPWSTTREVPKPSMLAWPPWRPSCHAAAPGLGGSCWITSWCASHRSRTMEKTWKKKHGSWFSSRKNQSFC